MDNTPILQQLAVSLALGLLVGLEREWEAGKVAGLRTFALLTVFGTVCGLLAGAFGGWVVAAGLIATVALLTEGHIMKYREGGAHAGLTTETAALVMYGVGAALTLGHMAPFVAVGGTVAVVLQWKQPLHESVKRLDRSEINAIFRLVLIGLVILPILPDRNYGPYQVLNPFRIWRMVVLIVGITLGGYISFRVLGARAGVVLGGFFGGIISSTATTVGYARRSRQSPEISSMATVVVLVATTIQFVRVAFEIAVAAPAMLPRVAAPLGAMTGIVLLVGIIFYLGNGEQGKARLNTRDPAGLMTAVAFGLLYALVLFGVAAARAHFGDRGLYIVAALSGMTDMDAITLTSAKMANEGRISIDTGWRMIVVGGLSNLVFKTAAVAALGHRQMLHSMSRALVLCLAGGGALLAFWPAVG